MKFREFLSHPWEVFVLAPSLETDDETLQYYYDFSQSLAELTKAFKELGMVWHWQPVTRKNVADVIDGIKKRPNWRRVIVLNYCDGDEINDVPGISVVRYLQKSGLIFTGAREPYYEITTSKIAMKQAFERCSVATAPWRVLNANSASTPSDLDSIEHPLIVKPAISSGSMGISINSVVRTQAELARQLAVLKEGCHGWDTAEGGIYVEQFISGREFTTLIVGDANRASDLVVFAPAERVFDRSLPEHEQFLSFDRLWEFYEKESPLPEQAPLYLYEPVEDVLAAKVKQLSSDAYVAVDGSGYGRVDLRMDSRTGLLYVLEVNAQCGLSEDENFTSVGAILRFEGKSFSDLLLHILMDAVQEAKHKKRKAKQDENLRPSA